MFSYTFNGKVLPERAHVSISSDPPFQINHNDEYLGLSFVVYLTISLSQILCVVNSEDEIVDLATLRNIVENMIRSMVDAMGYVEGRGYDVEITSVVGGKGQPWSVFGVEISQLQEEKIERPLDCIELLSLMFDPSQLKNAEWSLASGQVRRAFADLRESIRSPQDTAFHCFRAIECLRQSFTKPEDKDDDQILSWKRMGEALLIDKSWTDEFRETGMFQRHGAGVGVSAEERVLAMKRTWKVIDRFILYMKNGFQSLNVNEYETLIAVE